VPGHDVIVIGASAGGIEPLQRIVQHLPPDLPAALFVVVHTSAAPSVLPDVLNHAQTLRAAHAKDGESIEHGRIYVAPPDRHLLLTPDGVRVVRGPRENMFRPAIDPLFRTAARTFGPRVVGIILSGMLDDGTHGVQVIKDEGGIVIVQRPEEAAAPSMPLSAMQNVAVDEILSCTQIPAAIVRLARTPARQVDEMARKKTTQDVAEMAPDALEEGRLEGLPSVFTCPDCGGALWELHNGTLTRYRCHVGHGFTADALAEAQSNTVEDALWSALRSLEENAQLRRKMAAHTEQRGMLALSERLEADAKAATRRADTIRELLLSGVPPRVLSVASARNSGDRRASRVGKAKKINTRRPRRRDADE
jgi:two-component system chemotaxis response regulator CheB